RAEAARLAARLTRPGGPQLPPLVAARVQLLSALLKDDRPESTTRLVKSTGLGALALFAPAPVCVPAVSSQVVSSVLEILRCTQAADDDRRMLERLCAQVRTATRALAVGVFADERCQLTLVSSVGGRLDGVEATHVQRVDATIGPRAGAAASSYGGAPIRWGGQTIGVLQVCWPGRDGVSAGDWDPILSARPSGPVAELLGSSDAMAQVRAAVERAATAPFAVLIEGESGSGKELVARALHRRSARRDRGCCSVNCAALPDDLLESELFGHARGAFTGAMAERVGVFEEAHGGTLFLDEVGELSARAQAKLLRAIQEGEIRRVGENTPRRVDVRIVAATNRRLHEEVRTGRFRQDLLYRLDVIRIALPPLRDRAEDVALLAEHFWRDAAARVSSRATLSVATLAALARYDWPGNVRELQNVLASLVVRVPARGVVMPSSLPAAFHAAASAEGCRLDMAKRRFEAAFVRDALARAGGHRTKAAEELGVTRQGLTKLIARLGLDAAKQHNMPQSSAL
ncbi:MAG: sigma 54-interacting transcriptional regulator, partial [Vicinamibacterales bacterium]